MSLAATRAPGAPPRSPLGRGFWAWLAAATVSETGDGVLYFALVWTASGFGADVATAVMVAGLAPEVLLTLVGGAAGDRWGIRRTVVACSVAMGVVLALVLAAEASAAPTITVLLAAAVAQGVVSAFHRPANGVLPRLFFDQETLPRAMALTGAVLQLARIAGPPAGAVVVAAFGFAGALTADLVSFVGVVAVLLVVRPRSEASATAGSAAPGLRSGLRAVARVPEARALLGAVALLAGGLLPLLGLGVPLLARDRGWDAADAGLVEAAWIAGGLGVALLVTRRGTRDRALAPMAGGPALAALAVVGVALAPGPATACVAAAVMGIGTALFTSHAFPLYVLRSPGGMLARFQAVLVTVQMVALLLGNLTVGGLVAHGGVAPALGMAAVLCLLTVLPVLTSRSLRTARLR